MALVARVRIGGERLPFEDALAHRFVTAGPELDAAVDAGFTVLGPVPLVVRPLRLAGLPLVAPFGGKRQAAVREIAVREPRVTRLWERFCVDVGVALERDAAFVNARIFGRLDEGHRVLILEDGDRYAIRAMCIFRVEGGVGYVMELLHDRSVAGMRAASHLLGLAVREMKDAGAESVRAWSFPHSGTFPIFVRHAFVPLPKRLRAGAELHFAVRAVDSDLEPVVTRRDAWYLSYLDAPESLVTDSAERR